ncbi:MAG: ROK family protein [Rhizobiaceae bacterium]|nr:ROK family protein [Rhizobiaceae bacterium]
MVKIVRSDDMRQHNRAQVLSAIRRNKTVSRTEISAETKLSAATVSAITSDLLDEGIVSRLDPETNETRARPSTGRGRPKVSLGINASAAMVCAVYFQLNFVSASMFDYAGNLVSVYTLEISTEDITSGEIRDALIDSIEGALDRANSDRETLRHIELGFQGVTDVAGERLLWTPICTETNIPVRNWLESHFGVSAHVANDCELIARALNWHDPARYGENFAAVLLANGVGMGLFLRGGIINGTRSSGVEFGHMSYTPEGALCRCGNLGCIEAYAGDYAICRRAKGHDSDVSPSGVMERTDLTEVLLAAKEMDPNAIAAIHEAGAAIGTGLASLFAIVDRFPIVLVGRGATLFELMEPAIRKALEAAPGDSDLTDVEIECFADERPLVREGCSIRALMALDQEVASRRHTNEAAE